MVVTASTLLDYRPNHLCRRGISPYERERNLKVSY